MRRAGYLSALDEAALIRYMREIPWFDRDRHSLAAAVYAVHGAARCARVMHAFDAMYRDIKQEDALAILARLHALTHVPQRSALVPIGGALT
jgi:hypothetical protein